MSADAAASNDNGQDQHLLPAERLQPQQAGGKKDKGNVALLAELQEGHTGVEVGLPAASRLKVTEDGGGGRWLSFLA